MENPRKYISVGASPSDDRSEHSLNNNRQSQSYEEPKETFRILCEMSEILNCGLRGEALGHCIKLVEEGADPVRLAELIKKWRARAAATPDQSKQQSSITTIYANAKNFSTNGSRK